MVLGGRQSTGGRSKALALTVGLALALAFGRAEAQGLIGGRIRSADGTVGASTAISIRVFPARDGSNQMAYPGGVTYRLDAGGVYEAPFDGFPRPILVGDELHVVVENAAEGSTGSVTVPVLALDAAHVADLVLRVVPDANLVIRSLRAPAIVLRGERRARVEMAVENLDSPVKTPFPRPPQHVALFSTEARQDTPTE